MKNLLMKITPNRKFWIVLFSLFMFTSRYMSLEGSDNTRTSYLNEKWLDAIISIEIVDEKGNIQQKETGFLIKTESKHRVLVTASHVIRDINGKPYNKLQ